MKCLAKALSRRQGSESGLTREVAEQGCEIFLVQSNLFSPEFDAFLVLGGAQEVDGEVANHGHVLGAVAASKAGLVIAEDYVENLMKAFLDGPMTPDRRGAAGGVERGGGDVVAQRAGIVKDPCEPARADARRRFR
jgi:hypothetical protein